MLSSRSNTYATTLARSEEVLAEWLHKLAPWDLAVTVTIERRDPKSGLLVSRERINAAMRYFLERLNKCLFGHCASRHGYRVGSVFVIEHGVLGDHPHVHMTLTRPAHVSQPELTSHIERLIGRNSLFRREHAIRPYTSGNWHSYCLKYGADRLVAEEIETAFP